ncbi:hypothetical protein ACIQVU_19645 [Lysinibacillus sp. NPDC098008]|uniref:hypothetical protein n=1 Tax=Lysinibacillus sp. NPDC098008 TaxID=3364146 RepID=UPI003813EF02
MSSDNIELLEQMAKQLRGTKEIQELDCSLKRLMDVINVLNKIFIYSNETTENVYIDEENYNKLKHYNRKERSIIINKALRDYFAFESELNPLLLNFESTFESVKSLLVAYDEKKNG